MNGRHILATAALACAAAGAHALPTFDTNLGLDPSGKPVVGFVLSGTATTSYTLTLSGLSTFSGSLGGIGAITMDSITLKPALGSLISAGAPDSGTFSFANLGAGSYTLTFGYSGTGGFVGTVNTTPVPEPESVALALAGLGVVGFVAARRRQPT